RLGAMIFPSGLVSDPDSGDHGRGFDPMTPSQSAEATLDLETDAVGFSWSRGPEPHAERRRAILKAHPEVRELFGPCPRTKYVCTGLVAPQLAPAYLVRDAPFWLLALVGYLFGGVINHALLLAIHERSHNLASRRPVHARLFALFVNLPIV